MKKAHEPISQIKSLPDLNRFLSLHWKEFKINWKEIPKSVPESPEDAFLFRQIALEIEGFQDEKLKAQWQNYWLGCCLSSSFDYIFTVLKGCDVDREKDIVNLWKKGLLWKYLGSDHGKNYYFDKCLFFLLRRYSWERACDLRFIYYGESNDETNIFTKRFWTDFFVGMTSLILPRLIGTILIGFIPLVMADEIWQFPSKLFQESKWKYIFLIILIFASSYFYLFIECRNIIGKVNIKILIKRTFPVFIYGLLWSFVFTFLTNLFFLPYIPSKEITCAQQTLSTNVLFASAALFIGIFLQVFWEEKTITEPL